MEKHFDYAGRVYDRECWEKIVPCVPTTNCLDHRFTIR